jgi:hypothetical protein
VNTHWVSHIAYFVMGGILTLVPFTWFVVARDDRENGALRNTNAELVRANERLHALLDVMTVEGPVLPEGLSSRMWSQIESQLPPVPRMKQ